MLSIGEITQNIKKGQSSIKIKYVINALIDYAKEIAPNIAIVYAEREGSGVKMYYKVPSSVHSVTYDIVIWYNTTGRINRGTSVKIYSNSPGFGYNFAYVFNKEKSLLYPSKYPSIFITTPPKKRNPFETYAFDKHVFACMKITTKYNLSNAIDYFKDQKEPDIKNFEEKQNEISETRSSLKKKKETRKKEDK